jgi:hypothetical protein
MLRTTMLLLAALLAAVPASAITRDDFVVSTTEDLVDLCTTPETDSMYMAGISFCHGFLVGAYQYHVALHGGDKANPIVCPPQPTPTRAQAIDRYVAWTKAHPEYKNEQPVDTLVKFLVETWPCAKGAAAK